MQGGRLPQHRGLLGARHRDVHDPRRHLHAPLRLLPRADRQADAQRPWARWRTKTVQRPSSIFAWRTSAATWAVTSCRPCPERADNELLNHLPALRAPPPRAASCLRGTRGTRRRRSRCSRCPRRCRTWRSPRACRRRRRCENACDAAIASRERLGALGERVELEHADRAVPDDGAGLRERSRASARAVCGPMSRIMSSSADVVDRLDRRRRVGRERLGATTTSAGIGTSAPRAFIASMIALRLADQVGLGQRLADRLARRRA